MEHASVADLSVFAVAHLALNLEARLGQVDGEGPCNTNRGSLPRETVNHDGRFK